MSVLYISSVYPPSGQFEFLAQTLYNICLMMCYFQDSRVLWADSDEKIHCTLTYGLVDSKFRSFILFYQHGEVNNVSSTAMLDNLTSF